MLTVKRNLVLGAAALLLLIVAPAILADETASPVGLWQAHLIDPPTFAGPLTLETIDDARGAAPALRAWVDGVDVDVQLTKPQGGTRQIRFEVEGRGNFTGRLADGRSWSRQPIVGHWVQPGSRSYGGWATPMTLNLQPKTTGRWVGVAKPRSESLTFFFRVSEGEDGTLQVFLRNPERNLGIFARLATAEVEGQRVHFKNKDGETRIEADWDGDRMFVSIPDFGRHEFQRVAVDTAVGFAPRPRHGERRLLRTPESDSDWQGVRPEEVGMSSEKLDAMVRSIETMEIESVFSAALHAVVVARRGKLVLEEYFAGHTAETTHDTRSAGKSLGSMLTGAVQAQIPDVFDAESPICPLVDPSSQSCRSDARKADIKVKHLLTMSTGLACNDDDGDSPGNEGTMQNQSEQPDWYRFTLDLPMANTPGDKAHYCSATINLLGAVLDAATGRRTQDLFDELLAQPLGIETYHMNLDPLERGYLGGGIYLRPRDYLKFGEVMRNGGTWQGKRVLPRAWVEASTQGQAGLYDPGDYGYAWWRKTFQLGDRKLDAFYASGNGGQLLIVIPEVELTVAFMGGNYNNFGTWRNFRDKLLPEYILASITDLKD